MKYERFKDWFNELEVFSLRSERFYDDFSDTSAADRQLMVKWLQGAFEASREKSK